MLWPVGNAEAEFKFTHHLHDENLLVVGVNIGIENVVEHGGGEDAVVGGNFAVRIRENAVDAVCDPIWFEDVGAFQMAVIVVLIVEHDAQLVQYLYPTALIGGGLDACFPAIFGITFVGDVVAVHRF